MATTFRSTAHAHFVLAQLINACQSNAADQLGYKVRIELYRPDDEFSVVEDANTIALIDYLVSQQALSGAEKRHSMVEISEIPDNRFMMATQLDCKVTDLQQLKALAETVAQQAHVSNPAKFEPSSGKLIIGNQEIRFRRGNNDLFDMLVILMRDTDSAHALWVYDDDDHSSLKGQLDCPEDRSYAEFFRTTANNINRRVKDELGIDKFLIATTGTVQVNQQFV